MSSDNFGFEERGSALKIIRYFKVNRVYKVNKVRYEH